MLQLWYWLGLVYCCTLLGRSQDRPSAFVVTAEVVEEIRPVQIGRKVKLAHNLFSNFFLSRYVSFI